MREASFLVGNLGSGAGATGLGSSSAARLGAGISAVVGSGESVLVIVNVVDDGGLMVEVDVEVVTIDYRQPRNGFPNTSFMPSSTSGSQVNLSRYSLDNHSSHSNV